MCTCVILLFVCIEIMTKFICCLKLERGGGDRVEGEREGAEASSETAWNLKFDPESVLVIEHETITSPGKH